MMYSVEYIMTVTNSVKNSMELLTCAIFGQMSNMRYTFGE